MGIFHMQHVYSGVGYEIIGNTHKCWSTGCPQINLIWC